MEINTERASAMALLDRGVGFRIPAPFLFRIFGRKTVKISVKRLRLGTLTYLSVFCDLKSFEKLQGADDFTRELIQNMGFDAISVNLKSIEENKRSVSKAVAACLINSKWKIRLFTPILARHLRNYCTNNQLQELIMWMFVYGQIQSFWTTTKFLRKMTVTSPRI